MDQGALVAEQIDAGAALAHRFDKYPLQAAFWLKRAEDGQWFLYLVSDQINDSNFGLAYGEVIRLLGPGPHIWLEPSQVKVRGANQPVAKAVLAIQQEYPGHFPMRLRSRMLGDLYVDEVFIYPIPVPTSG
jgi:hypothetical protein